MRELAVALRRDATPTFVVGMVAILAASVLLQARPEIVAPLVLVAIVAIATHRRLLQWHSLIGAIALVILFVPIKRYRLPANLPFHLELYRIVVAVVVVVWLASLLIDPRVRLRRTAFDAPLLLIVACVFASELANPGRVSSYLTDGVNTAALSSYVAKSITFFLSFVLVYYVAATALRRREGVVTLFRVMTFGAAVVAVFAVIERQTKFNVFYHLHSILPFLQFTGASELVRFGSLRVYGSAQHPIALGAALAAVVPLAVYLARIHSRRWWAALLLLLFGALASGSRTAVVMLIVELLVFLRLKPLETRRLWPAAVPAVVLIHVLLPGAIGGFKEAFFPKGGIVAEQATLAPGEDPNLAGGRIRQLVPGLKEAAGHPLFGEGFGTRISGFDEPLRNAPILDNQWLNIVLEVGYVGLGIWIWLFTRVVRRLSHASRNSTDGDDWLFAAVEAAILAFGVGMLTFDAFSFIQVTFLFWLLLGIAGALLRLREQEDGREVRRHRQHVLVPRETT